MSSLKEKIKFAVNKLAKNAEATHKKLLGIVENKRLTGTFSQVTFSDAASAENASRAIGFSVGFVNDELDGNTLSSTDDECLLETCQEIKQQVMGQLKNTITLTMDTTKIHEVNGLNRALDELNIILS